MKTQQPQRSGKSVTASASRQHHHNPVLTHSTAHAQLQSLYGLSLTEQTNKAIVQLGMTPPTTIVRGILHQFDGARKSDVQTDFCLPKSYRATFGDFDTSVDLYVTRDTIQRMRIGAGL